MRCHPHQIHPSTRSLKKTHESHEIRHPHFKLPKPDRCANDARITFTPFKREHGVTLSAAKIREYHDVFVAVNGSDGLSSCRCSCCCFLISVLLSISEHYLPQEPRRSLGSVRPSDQTTRAFLLSSPRASAAHNGSDLLGPRISVRLRC